MGNNLESYCFNMKSTLEDEKLKDKISEADRKTINDKCDEAIKWLDINQTADKDEYADKQKEVEGICNPIITKLYQQAGGLQGECQERECLEQEQEDLSQELQVQVVLLDKDQLLKRWTKHFMSW